MTAQRVTDAQIAAALRAYLPAHARSDVPGRIAAEVRVVRQEQPWPSILGALSAADPRVRRQATLLAAAALLALAVVAAAAVGTLLRRDVPLRITADPARDPAAFVEQAYAAHRALPAMTLVVPMWDLAEGPVDRHRFVFDGAGSLRHECCDGTIIIQTGATRGSTNIAGESEIVWVLEPTSESLPGFELVQYTGFMGSRCELGWRYVGPDTVAGRQAHHVACSRPPEGDVAIPDLELWLDAELGIVLRSRTWGVQVDEDGDPVAAYGSEALVESIVFGAPAPELFEPPPGLRVLTGRELNCESDPANCEPERTERPVPPATTPEAVGEAPPPDVAALVAAAHEWYAGLPAMAIVVELRGGLTGERRLFSDGAGSLREEWHFDPDSPANPTVSITNAEGSFESWYSPERPKAWVRHDRTWEVLPALFHLGLPETCPDGWRYLGLDVLLGEEAWHVGCGHREFWLDRDRPLVLRMAEQPDPLRLDAESQTVLSIALGRQPEDLFELPADAVISQR